MNRSKRRLSRREFGVLSTGTLVPLLLGEACTLGGAFSIGDGRLTARPNGKTRTTASGTRALGLGESRDAILQMPAAVPDGPMPLLVFLHGAGGAGERVLPKLGTAPSSAGIAVLAPDSRGGTWDAIRDDFGEDIAFLDRALDRC